MLEIGINTFIPRRANASPLHHAANTPIIGIFKKLKCYEKFLLPLRSLCLCVKKGFSGEVTGNLLLRTGEDIKSTANMAAYI